jgi:hypothetical protein
MGFASVETPGGMADMLRLRAHVLRLGADALRIIANVLRARAHALRLGAKLI